MSEFLVPAGAQGWGEEQWRAFLGERLEDAPPTFFLLVGCEAGIDTSSPLYAIFEACEGGWGEQTSCQRLLSGWWRAVLLVEKDVWWDYERSGLRERVDAIEGVPEGTGCDALAVVLHGILRGDDLQSVHVVRDGEGFLCRATCAGRLDLQDRLRGVPGYGCATVSRAECREFPRGSGVVISAGR